VTVWLLFGVIGCVGTLVTQEINMTANIAKIDGKDATAWTGAMPWHKLGTKLPGLLTPEQALIAASCNYEVVKVELGVVDSGCPEYYGIQIPNTFSTGRLGPELMDDGVTPQFIPFEGSVKGRYTIVQNIQAFNFLTPALGKDIAYLETVGALGNGEKTWAMAKLPDTFEALPGDPIQQYILIANSHDGTGSILACMTPVRVVCQNTLSMAISGATHLVKIRHTKSANKRVDQLHKLLEASDNYWERLKEAFKTLQMRDMTQLEVIDFIETMFPGKREKVNGVEVDTVPTKTANMRTAVLSLFEGNAQGSDKAGRTHYGMFNAYTEWLDGTNPSESLRRSIRKTSNYWEASMFGSGVNKRQDAYNMLIKQAS
jgi:phage/plasmid-like protein (TIGR03299 family)